MRIRLVYSYNEIHCSQRIVSSIKSARAQLRKTLSNKCHKCELQLPYEEIGHSTFYGVVISEQNWKSIDLLFIMYNVYGEISR